MIAGVLPAIKIARIRAKLRPGGRSGPRCGIVQPYGCTPGTPAAVSTTRAPVVG
jgi:hypothetical protein